MIRKGNKYKRPKKAYQTTRIKEENVIRERFALKNKREIWKTLAKVNYFRKRAMDLSKAPQEEKEVFLGKLKLLGLKTESITDVLSLTTEDLLNRRLPTIVHKKGLSTTIRQARQMAVHKKVLIDGRVVNSPSYLVPLSEENLISIKEKIKKPKEVKQEPEVTNG